MAQGKAKVILIMILDSEKVLEIRQRFFLFIWDIVWYKVVDG